MSLNLIVLCITAFILNAAPNTNLSLLRGQNRRVDASKNDRMHALCPIFEALKLAFQLIQLERHY